MPVLVDFLRALGFQEPHRVLDEPHLLIAGRGSWGEAQPVGVEDRAWLATKMKADAAQSSELLWLQNGRRCL